MSQCHADHELAGYCEYLALEQAKRQKSKSRDKHRRIIIRTTARTESTHSFGWNESIIGCSIVRFPTVYSSTVRSFLYVRLCFHQAQRDDITSSQSDQHRVCYQITKKMSEESGLRRSSRRIAKPVRYTSDSESSDEEQDNDEYTIDTRSTKRRKTVKETRISRKNAAELPETQNGLFDSLADETTDLTAQALEWLQAYQDDNETALVEFCNCLIKLSGSNLTVGSDIFTSDDEESSSLIQAVERLEEQLHVYPISEYSLNHKTDGKHFRRSVSQFIIGMVNCSAEKGLLYENDGDFINPIVNWSVAMSSSHCRAFRHVGTFVSLNILGALIEIQVERQKRLAKIEQRASKGSNAAKKRAKSQAADERSKIELTSHYIDAILETVFSARQKDVDPKIRLESFKLLGNWTLIMPELFLVNDYLRYFGWALSDPSAQVRQQVVTSLIQLYKTPNFESALRQFSDRFNTRFVEMATFDADNQVRKLMVDLLSTMTDLGFADSTNVTDKISSAIFDSDGRVRKSAASFLIGRVQSVVEKKFNDEPSLEKYLEENMDTSWYFFKELVNKIMELNDTTNNQENGFNSLRLKSQTSPIAIAANSIFEALEDKNDSIQQLSDMLLFDYTSLTEKRGSRLIQNVCIDDRQAEVLVALLQGFVGSKIRRETEKSKKQKSDSSVSTVAEFQGQISSICQLLMTKYHYSTTVFSQILRLLSLVDHDSYATLHQEEKEKLIFDFILKEFLEQTSETVLIECSNLLMKATESSRFRSYATSKLLDAVKSIEMSLNKAKEAGFDAGFVDLWLLKSVLIPADPAKSVYASFTVENARLIQEHASNGSVDTMLKFLEFVKGYTASRVKSSPYEGEQEILIGFLRSVYGLHANEHEIIQLETAFTMTDCLILLKLADDSYEGDSGRFEDNAQLRTAVFECENAVGEYYKKQLIRYSKVQEFELDLEADEDEQITEMNESQKVYHELQLCTLAAKLCTAVDVKAVESQVIVDLLKISQTTSSRLGTVIKQASS